MIASSGEAETVPITAIVTAYKRIDQTIHTLRRIKSCYPPPEEILVHVDGGERGLKSAIQQEFPEVKILVSEENVGPGGGRNKLIAAAQYDLIASFDDDSYPLDNGYFQRLIHLFERFSEASILCARVFHRDETIDPGIKEGDWVADFSGGACAYRRQAFLRTTGYVPLPVAYGMEEVDLAMRLHAEGGRIFRTSWLRVFHDTTLERHDDPRVTSNSITNLALLTFLRYPVSFWWIGVVQVVKRILWLIENGRRSGIMSGLYMIPGVLYEQRVYRVLLPRAAIHSYFKLRHSASETIIY